MIYANGCSFTSGWPDEEIYGHRQYAWPHLLSLRLGEDILNDARAASSNYRIYRRTFDYILNHKPKIAIICITSWLRRERGITDSGLIYQYNISNHPKEFLKDWHPYLAYSNFLRQIISLQITAKSRNTDLYILDGFKNNLQLNPTYDWFVKILQLGGVFDNMDDKRIEKKFNVIKNLNQHIDYSTIMPSTLEDIVEGTERVETGHPRREGHERVAEFIYNFIQNK
jgi:hypothetical protein